MAKKHIHFQLNTSFPIAVKERMDALVKRWTNDGGLQPRYIDIVKAAVYRYLDAEEQKGAK
jgi:hypothetical protein